MWQCGNTFLSWSLFSFPYSNLSYLQIYSISIWISSNKTMTCQLSDFQWLETLKISTGGECSLFHCSGLWRCVYTRVKSRDTKKEVRDLTAQNACFSIWTDPFYYLLLVFKSTPSHEMEQEAASPGLPCLGYLTWELEHVRLFICTVTN